MICSILLLSNLALLQQGAPAKAQDAQEKPQDENVSIVIPNGSAKRTIQLPTGEVRYTATWGQIPIRSDAGETECRMFYVAYTKDGEPIGKRPLTFAFNGGPGSATIWLHFGALGPKRAPMKDDGSLGAPPYAPVDNSECWLDFSDVVMIDAPGTGFSRLVKQDFAPKYFGVRQDVTAFAKFIQGFITEKNRWSSPLFVCGESYGGIRGSALSAELFNNGIALNGFISVSGTSNFMTLDGMRGNDLTYLGFFPTFANTAFYHHKLSAQFKSVEQTTAAAKEFVVKEYGPALLRGDALTDAEKDHIAQRMSELIGVSKQFCLGSNLRIPEWAFFRELLRNEGLTVGRFDSRLTVKQENKSDSGIVSDPSDDATGAPFITPLNDYYRSDLGVKTDMPYLPGANVYPWKEDEGRYSETATDLRNLMAKNPHFKVLYCCGYYDLACPFYATIYTVDHMGLDAEQRSRVSYAYYPAGHMMYIEKGSRKKFHDDAAAFVRECLTGK